MVWTYEQRMLRVSQTLIDRNKLDESQIQTVKRPLFFERFKFSIGMSLVLSSWGDYPEVKDKVTAHLQGLDCLIQSYKKSKQWFIFSSDPSVIRKVIQLSMFDMNHLRMVDPKCWHWKLPEPKPKGKFYGEFGWRFEFRNPSWGKDPTNQELLDGLTSNYKLVISPRTFLYLSTPNDVLLFKLVAVDQLLSLDERT